MSSLDEIQTRVQLAALFRMIDHFGWGEVILNHTSARVPGKTDEYFINPFGTMYHEITASSLVRVNLQGEVLSSGKPPVNMAGLVLHSAIYAARPDVNCIIHTHTPNGVAVASLECGLLCNDQMSLMFYNNIGYHAYEGITVEEDEKTRIVTNLGKYDCLILRNHGLVATGQSISLAFWNYYQLEAACKVQLKILSTQTHVSVIPEEIKKRTFEQHEKFNKNHGPAEGMSFGNNAEVAFAALLRLMDKKDKSYQD